MNTQETLDIEQVLKEKRNKILEIATRHGARNVRVFGSVVRGEAKTDSDIGRLMSDMRNVIAHEYFQVNLRILWNTVQNNLPPLIAQIQELVERKTDQEK